MVLHVIFVHNGHEIDVRWRESHESVTVTITGCGTTVLAADYGGIVETTATLHTYSFHRLVPKATEVTSVATNVSPNITNINTVANNISDVNNFADLYQISTSAPSTDGSGNSLVAGDLWFDSSFWSFDCVIN